jgi:hypothetical protein
MVTKVCCSPRRTSRVTLADLSKLAELPVELFGRAQFDILATRNQRQDDVAGPQVDPCRIVANLFDQQTAAHLELALLLRSEFGNDQPEAISGSPVRSVSCSSWGATRALRR